MSNGTRNPMLRACLPLLRDVGKGFNFVTPENLIQAAYLVECHYAEAEHDYEGLVLHITKQGEKVLELKP